MKKTERWRKSKDSSVDIVEYPRRNKKILPNFDFFLPNFHFILPNFYFPVPWGIFICSVELFDFLRRDGNQQRLVSLWDSTTSRPHD